MAGNPVAMAAGLKTLDLITVPGFFDDLSQKTRSLVDGLKTLAMAAGIPFSTHAVGGMFGLYFSSCPSITRFDEVMTSDIDRFKRFFHGMLEEGVYLAPSAFEAGFVSMAHDEAVIAETLAAAEKVFKRL